MTKQKALKKFETDLMTYQSNTGVKNTDLIDFVSKIWNEAYEKGQNDSSETKSPSEYPKTFAQCPHCKKQVEVCLLAVI